MSDDDRQKLTKHVKNWYYSMSQDDKQKMKKVHEIIHERMYVKT